MFPLIFMTEDFAAAPLKNFMRESAESPSLFLWIPPKTRHWRAQDLLGETYKFTQGFKHQVRKIVE
jgi:hypothetical protein